MTCVRRTLGEVRAVPGRAGLEPAADVPLMKHRAVGERRDSGVVLERETGKLIPLGQFEIAVLDLDRRPRVEHRHSLRDNKRLVDDRQALGEIGVLGEQTIAVADRENRGDQLELGLGRGGFHAFHVAKVEIGHSVKHLELVVGEYNARVAAAARSLEKCRQVVHRPIDLKVEATVEPALAVRRIERAEVGRTARSADRGEKCERNQDSNRAGPSFPTVHGGISRGSPQIVHHQPLTGIPTQE